MCIDTQDLTFRVPDKKIDRLKSKISALLPSRRTTANQLASGTQQSISTESKHFTAAQTSTPWLYIATLSNNPATFPTRWRAIFISFSSRRSSGTLHCFSRPTGGQGPIPVEGRHISLSFFRLKDVRIYAFVFFPTDMGGQWPIPVEGRHISTTLLFFRLKDVRIYALVVGEE